MKLSALSPQPLALLATLIVLQGALSSQGAPPPAPVEFKNRAPVNKDILKITLPRAQEADLSNGAHLMVLEDHRVPSIAFQIIVIGAGGYYDPKDLPGLADTTASLMDEGTATKTSEQIAQQLDALAASVSITANEGSQISTVSGSSMSDQLDPVLELAADILQHPKFADEELARYKTRAAAALEEQRGDPEFLAQERYSKAIYGDHPASSTGLTKEALAKISRADLVKFHRDNYLPDYAIIAVAGDITLADARTKFETALKTWKKGGKPRPGVVEPPNAGPSKVSIVNRASSVQTSYMIGAQAINRTHPDYDAVQVMNTIFGGSNGRLFRELREVKGYTYGVYSQLRALRYRGDERVSMDVRTEVTEPSLRDFLAEVEKMRTQPVPDAEFKDAQRAMTASFALSLEQPSEVLGLYVLRQLYNLPADYWDKYADRINAITPAQVQAVARKYLDPAQLQIVAVGDASKVEASLRKFGPVEMYNDEGQPLKTSQ